MSPWRIFFWAVTGLMALIPLNWIRLGITGELPTTTKLSELLIGTLILWGLAGGLAFFLVVSARGIRLRKEREQREVQALLNGPLVPVQPRRAIVKPEERAYASAMGSIQEVKTVGFKAGSSGMSVRVAKGLTLRTGGTRGHSVKGVVTVATGELVATDQRVIFAGDFKSFSIPLRDLVSVTPYADGFGLSNGRSTYTVITSDDRERMLFGAVLERLLRG